MTKKVSKKAKQEFEKKVAETFGRATEKKQADRLTNHEVKIEASGLTSKKYEAFTKKHGFEYLQTFTGWKKAGYSIKKGAKGKALEMYTKTASGNWALKTYYYFDFTQVKSVEEVLKEAVKASSEATKTFFDYTTEQFLNLTEAQQEALLPF